jgi:thioredoxin 1
MMKKLLKIIVTVGLFQSVFAFAAGQPFTQSQFDTLMKEGKPVVIHVHAPWCPNCKAQDPVINAKMKSPEYKSVSFLEVDFDSQKDVLKKFNVSTQSTIIVFKDGKEVSRSIGKTKESDIAELTHKAL